MQTTSEIKEKLEILEKLLYLGMYDEFIFLESNFYTQYIKIKETQDHHQQLFSFLDPIIKKYGQLTKAEFIKFDDDKPTTKDNLICFFLPSLDSDLAHIQQLTTLLRAYQQQFSRRIVVAGFTSNTKEPRSYQLREVANKYKIPLLCLTPSHNALKKFCNFLVNENLGLLISYSVPVLLPFWLEILGPEKVAWFTTKFKLSSFSKLRFGIAPRVGGSQITVEKSGDMTWYSFTVVMTKEYVIDYHRNNTEKVKFISINRSEKIRDRIFLDTVARLLEKDSNFTFSWTGLSELNEISDFFRSRGVLSRTKFLGWVNPVSAFNGHDIFLDAFSLSGIVCASAFASGMPVVVMRGSNSWIGELHDERLIERDGMHERLDRVVATSPVDYLNKAVEFARQVSEHRFDGQWQRTIAAQSWFNPKAAAVQFDSVLTLLLSERAKTVIET